MNIRLATSVLQNERWYPVLDVVLDIISQSSSHASLDPTQYSELLSSPWLRNATGPRAVIAELIRGSIRTLNRQPPATSVTLVIDATAPSSGEIQGTGVMRFPPLKAIALLAQPLQIIVEDETSDGGFLLWMARLLGKDSIRTAYQAGRLSFRHAGGKGQMVKSARALTFGVWPKAERPISPMKLRCCAILDSDSRYPGDNRNDNIRSQVAPYVAFAYVLAGRAIENYVPRKYAEARLSGSRQALAAYFALSDEQKQYFPLKTGFRDGGAPPQPQSLDDFKADANRSLEERALFDQVSETNWNRINGGFGDSLSAVYHEEIYRCDPGASHLLSVIQQQELATLLVLIGNYI